MLDLFSREVLVDPYPHYRRLRDDAPCFHDETRNVYVLSRFDDVYAAARNHAVFSSTGGVGLDWNQRPMMPMYDPPEHTRMRRLVARHFTPAAATLMKERIEANMNALLEPLLEAGKAELIDDLLIPLSLGTIADLIGVPKADRAQLRKWSQGTIDDLAGGLAPEAHEHVEALRREFVTYLKSMIADRRAAPVKQADILSLLLDASDDDRLAPKEVLAFGVLLLVAGFETTVNGIANGVLALTSHPDACRMLRGNDALVTGAVEESIRWDGPVQSFFRNTLSETTIHGVTIPKGVKVMLLFGSANRDERRFADPDTFRIDRGDSDHVGFGAGIHYCLGAPLARQQMAVAARALLKRTKALEIDGDVDRYHSVLFRGVKRLPVRFTPA